LDDGKWKKTNGFEIVRNIYRNVPGKIIETIDEKQNNLEEFINKRLVPMSKK
jgi:hypothetical protein